MTSVAARHASQPSSRSRVEQCEDHVVLLPGVSWEQYTALLESRGERTLPRMDWLDGVLELMSPSIDHESIAALIGRLLLFWCAERGISINDFRSWTVRDESSRRGAESDGCYVIGRGRKDRPDLAVEVIWTHGGLDKLEVWRGLGVSEVWIWEGGDLVVWVLEGDRYASSATSRLLPDLDVALLGQYASEVDQTAAVQEFLRACRNAE